MLTENYNTFFEFLLTIVTTFAASSGFWLFVSKKRETVDASRKLLIGLAHDRILYLANKYIERGSVSKDEYENLYDFLYCPYIELNGNGTAKRLVEEVNKLKISSEKEIKNVIK